MKRFYLTLGAIIVMAALIPQASEMAVSPSSPLASRLCYMFGHANVLHWAVNGWALMVLHNIFRVYRLIVAYVLAVAVSFIPSVTVSLSLDVPYVAVSSQQLPIIGASVITCFFFGMLNDRLWITDRLTACLVAALLFIGFFIPGISAVHHLLMFVAGIAWFQVERIIRSFRKNVMRCNGV